MAYGYRPSDVDYSSRYSGSGSTSPGQAMVDFLTGNTSFGSAPSARGVSRPSYGFQDQDPDDEYMEDEIARTAKVAGGMTYTIQHDVTDGLSEVQSLMANGATPETVLGKRKEIIDTVSALKQERGFSRYRDLWNAGDEGRRISYMLQSIENGSVWSDPSVLQACLYGITKDEWGDMRKGKPAAPAPSGVTSVDTYVQESGSAARLARQSLADKLNVSSDMRKSLVDNYDDTGAIHQWFSRIQRANRKDPGSVKDANEAAANIEFYDSVLSGLSGDVNVSDPKSSKVFDEFMSQYVTATNNRTDTRRAISTYRQYIKNSTDTYGKPMSVNEFITMDNGVEDSVLGTRAPSSVDADGNESGSDSSGSGNSLSRDSYNGLRALINERHVDSYLWNDSGWKGALRKGLVAEEYLKNHGVSLRSLSISGRLGGRKANDMLADYVEWCHDGPDKISTKYLDPNDGAHVIDKLLQFAHRHDMADVTASLPDNTNGKSQPGSSSPSLQVDEIDQAEAKLANDTFKVFSNMSYQAYLSACADTNVAAGGQDEWSSYEDKFRSLVNGAKDYIGAEFGLTGAALDLFTDAYIENEKAVGTGSDKVMSMRDLLHSCIKRPGEEELSGKTQAPSSVISELNVSPNVYDSFVARTQGDDGDTNMQKLQELETTLRANPAAILPSSLARDEKIKSDVSGIADRASDVYKVRTSDTAGHMDWNTMSGGGDPADSRTGYFAGKAQPMLERATVLAIDLLGTEIFGAGPVLSSDEIAALQAIPGIEHRLNGEARLTNGSIHDINDSDPMKYTPEAAKVYTDAADFVEKLITSVSVNESGIGIKYSTRDLQRLAIARDIICRMAPAAFCASKYAYANTGSYFLNYVDFEHPVFNGAVFDRAVKMLSDKCPEMSVSASYFNAKSYITNTWVRLDDSFKKVKKSMDAARIASDKAVMESDQGSSTAFKGSPFAVMGVVSGTPVSDEALNTGHGYFDPLNCLQYLSRLMRDEQDRNREEVIAKYDTNPSNVAFRKLENRVSIPNSTLARVVQVARSKADVYGLVEGTTERTSYVARCLNDARQFETESDRADFLSKLKAERIVFVPYIRNQDGLRSHPVVRDGRYVPGAYVNPQGVGRKLTGAEIGSADPGSYDVYPMYVPGDRYQYEIDEIYGKEGSRSVDPNENQAVLADLFHKNLAISLQSKAAGKVTAANQDETP